MRCCVGEVEVANSKHLMCRCVPLSLSNPRMKNSRRNTNEGFEDAQRRASAADYQPFSAEGVQQWNTTQITPQTVSAEEFPWASTFEGGSNAYIFPATIPEQRCMFLVCTLL